MKVADLSPDAVHRLVRGQGLAIKTGPLVFRIKTNIASAARGLARLYAGHATVPPDNFIDFDVDVRSSRAAPLGRQRATFSANGIQPFEPVPINQAFALLEWGLNWCVHSQSNQLLSMHSAALSHDGKALLMPADSGSGKSTLCAALCFRGWDLLSDELALIDPTDGLLWPLARPISLKNQSIEVIKAWAQDAVWGEIVEDTHKGSICHVVKAGAHVALGGSRPKGQWVVFPRWKPGAALQADPISRGQGFMRLRDQTFNYADLGLIGFTTLTALASDCLFYELTYGDLHDAVNWVNRLAGR